MRILVIEDQEKLANSIKSGLEKNGYAVDALYDGSQAMQRLEYSHKNYDLVVLDIMLPGVDGLSICKYLRDNKINLPVIMLTAKDALNDKVKGLNIGADDYLVKPFAFDELVARVKALLRRPVDVMNFEISMRGIVLNTVSRKVTKDNKDITLTTKEFSILEQFMTHPSEVLSREKIINHVWDFAFDGFSNVVDVHIKNLRKKLQNKNENIFETLHGSGYRFNP